MIITDEDDHNVDITAADMFRETKKCTKFFQATLKWLTQHSDYAGKDGEREARADPKALAGGMGSDYQIIPSYRFGFSNTW